MRKICNQARQAPELRQHGAGFTHQARPRVRTTAAHEKRRVGRKRMISDALDAEL